ncbi:CBO0543 family protein [Bacillus sp. AK128]
MDKKLLKIFLCIGFLLIPFAFKREGLKDWMIVFFLKGYISSFIGTVVVRNNQLSYPVRFMRKFFRISILFDYLLFPLICVFFNRVTVNKNSLATIGYAIVFSLPMTILEVILERFTDLIKYKNNWSWLITLITLTITFLFVRVSLGLIRSFDLAEDIRAQ